MNLMSVDPGTYKTGVGIWIPGQAIVACLLVVKQGIKIEHRLAQLVERLTDLGRTNHIDTFAVERPFIDKDHPAPEINVLMRRLKQLARQYGWDYFEYAPGTVTSRVRPSGTRGMTLKDVNKLGINMLYGTIFPGVDQLDQNVIDALCVGHCHLAMVEEARMVTRAALP